MELRPPVDIIMGPNVQYGRAQFMFRNLVSKTIILVIVDLYVKSIVC